MSTLLACGILAILTGCLAVLMRKRFEEQLPLSVTLIVAVLYFFSLAGQLMAGFYTVLALTAAAGAGTVWLLWKRRAEKPLRLLMTPGFAAFFLVALWLLLCFRGHMFTAWDDFSHWGLAVKNMHMYQALPAAVPQSTVTYRDYPPATTLFSWFWTQLSGGFNEGDPQRALNMLMMCFLLPLMRKQRWKKWGSSVSMALALFLLPLAFHAEAYRTLAVDLLLGCLVLHALTNWFLVTRDKHTLLVLSCSLFLLPIVKETGVMFALLVLVIIGVDIIMGKDSEFNKLKMLLVLVLSIALSRLSWVAYLQLNDIPKVWNPAAISFTEIIKMFLWESTPYRTRALANFWEALCDPTFLMDGHIVQLSYVMWVAVFALAAGWIIHVGGENARRYRRCFGILAVGLVVYTFALLIVLQFLFRMDEAENLASLDRYLSSYLLPMVMFPALILHRHYMSKERNAVSSGLCLLAVLLMVVNPLLGVQETVLAWEKNEAAYKQRMNQLVPTAVMAQLDSEKDLVYVVSSRDDGKNYYKSAYQFTPVRIQQGMTSAWVMSSRGVLVPGYRGVVYSPQEWADVLLSGGFTHVYLQQTDIYFQAAFKDLFADPENIKAGKLYRIETVDGQLRMSALN